MLVAAGKPKVARVARDAVQRLAADNAAAAVASAAAAETENGLRVERSPRKNYGGGLYRR